MIAQRRRDVKKKRSGPRKAAPCFRFLYSIMMSRVPKAASHATMH